MIGSLLDTFMLRPAIFVILSCMMMIFFIIFPAYTWGDEFKIVPSVKVQEKYDDNIYFSTSEYQESDIISTVTPRVELKFNDSRLAASLQGSVAGISYVDNNDFNAVDQFLRADLSYMVSQRVRTQVHFAFIRDSQRDRDVEETGLPILSTSGRERLQYDVGGFYTLSEKTLLNLSYAFSRDRYEVEALTGLQTHYFSLGLRHDLSQYVPELMGTMNIGTKRYDYPDRDIQNTTVTVGASWQYSEKVSLTGAIGPRFSRTEYEYDVPVFIFDFFDGWRHQSETIDGQGLDGSMSCAYQGLLSSWKLSLARNLDQASGRSGASERTSTVLDISRRLTEELSLGFQGSYYVNKSDQGDLSSQEIDTRTWRVQPRIDYKLSRNLSLKASYSYLSVHESRVETERTKNAVFLELMYAYPLFD